MATRPLWILADPHGGHDPDADRGLIDLLDAAARQAVDLLIMGDLFVAWLGPERFWTTEQRRVLERIAKVRAAGGRTRFVVGNRDYLVESLRGQIFDAVYDGEVVTDVAGRLTLLCHGDRLNRADWPYLAWHRLSRSRAARAALRRLPGAVGRGLAERTEARMRSMHPAYKTGHLPMEGIQALGRRAHERGAVRALVGHFHHDRTLAVAGGSPVTVVPGWLDHQRVLVASEGGDLISTPGDVLICRP